MFRKSAITRLGVIVTTAWLMFGHGTVAYAVTVTVDLASFSAARAQGSDVSQSGFPPPFLVSDQSPSAMSTMTFIPTNLNVPTTGASFRVEQDAFDMVDGSNTGGQSILRFSLDVDTPYQIVGNYDILGTASQTQLLGSLNLLQSIPFGGFFFNEGFSINAPSGTNYTPGSMGGTGSTTGMLSGGFTYDFEAQFHFDPDGPGQSEGVGFFELRLGDAVQVPEPSVVLLLGFGLVGLGYLKRRRPRVLRVITVAGLLPVVLGFTAEAEATTTIRVSQESNAGTGDFDANILGFIGSRPFELQNRRVEVVSALPDERECT